MPNDWFDSRYHLEYLLVCCYRNENSKVIYGAMLRSEHLTEPNIAFLREE